MISCPEEIAFRMGFITRDQLKKLGEALRGNNYGEYILEIARKG
jgi:glucose-1-phosphate thymidylyltransferase